AEATKRIPGADTVRPAFIPLYQTRFVGRESQLETLRESLSQACEGHGRIITIGGEPGVGKTRLASEIALEAWNSGAQLFFGRCYEQSETLPYIPFVEALEHALRMEESARH